MRKTAREVPFTGAERNSLHRRHALPAGTIGGDVVDSAAPKASKVISAFLQQKNSEAINRLTIFHRTRLEKSRAVLNRSTQ